MLKTFMEVFMDDFSVFGDSFDLCLNNLEKMLIRCKQAHLVLNWEKCHFMVTERIMLGHKVSRKGLEVDKAKIDVITKLPPPTNVKAIRSFLGHYGFYRRFIKDFSKISRPMTKLLEKDSVFNFDEECNKAFETLKEKLTNGARNVAADHLSRPEKPNLKELKDEEINDEFPDEFLMIIKDEEESPCSNLISKWYGPFIVKHGYPSEYVELYDTHGGSFIVNGHRIKLYHDEEQLNELTIEDIHLMCEEGSMKAIPLMAPFPANYRKIIPWASEKPYIYSVVENTCDEAKLYDLDETRKGIVIENILLKKYSKKDKIGSKSDKNEKRVEVGKSQKQLQWIEEEKLNETQKEWPKTQMQSKAIQSFKKERKKEGLNLQLGESYKWGAISAKQ
nr:reverse transcriptase domain-containing protein [Tanacetum cinerariifolium]